MFNSTVKTKFIGLFGNPLGQSAAAYMHNSVYQALNMDCFYVPYEIEMEDLEHVIKNLKRFHFAGASIMMPFKAIVYRYLNALDESSKCTEVVNTVVIDEDGRLIGYNSDGFGCVRSLEEQCGLTIPDHRYLILGAGGAASAVSAALARQGAKDIKILNIKDDFAIAEKLQRRLEMFYPGCSSIDYMNDCTIKSSLSDYDVVIHATKIGMFPMTDAVLFNTRWLLPEHTVCDVVYVPVETKLLKEAKERGCTTLSGLWMNVNVAAEQMRLWFGISAPTDFMYLAGTDYLRAQGRLRS
ncbi:shikimate dehydrogenase family protein [Cloacibacillus sp.]